MSTTRSRRGRAALTINGDITTCPEPSPQQWLQALKSGRLAFNEIIRQRNENFRSAVPVTNRHFKIYKVDRLRSHAYVYYRSAPVLDGLDLRGMDLRGYNLRSANFGRAQLSNTDLRGATLDHANFGGASLRWANLSGTRLHKVGLNDVHLQGADLSGCVIDACEITSGERGHGAWNDVNLEGAHFRDCTISGWNCSARAPQLGITFTRCRLRHDTIYAADDSSTIMPVRLCGDIGRIILDRSRVHSLQLHAKGCTLIAQESVYLWIEAKGLGSVLIENETLRDHGGRITCVSIPSRVTAPRWEALRVETDRGNGLVLECMPRRVQAEYDQPTPLSSGLRSYVAEWERGRSQAFEIAARKRGMYV